MAELVSLGDDTTNTSTMWRLVLRGTSCIATVNEGRDGPAFYCVHANGGDVRFVQDLAPLLGPEQGVYGIQVPKEKMTSAFAASIEVMARHYVEALVAFQPEGPIVLGGWSAGAIIALEMAQQLRAIGRDVPLLVALDGAPCNTAAGISRWSIRYNRELLCNLPLWLKEGQQQNWSLRIFGRRVFKRLAFRVLTGVRAIRSEQTLHGSMVQDLLNKAGWSTAQISFIRALYDAQRAYVPNSYAGRVLLYEARTQPLFHLLQLGAAWTKIANQTEIVPLDGGHGSIFQESTIGMLARHLRGRLAELRKDETTEATDICKD